MPFQPKEWEPNPRWVPREQRARRAAAEADGEPTSTTVRVPREASRVRTDLWIFLGTLVAALGMAVTLYYGLEVWNADSLSRTIDAQSVLFSRDPHLGAIGFVWPPLPTIARIVLLPLTDFLRIGDFTGQITSVLFAAGAVVLLHRILRDLGLPLVPRVIWMAVAVLNPVVLLHFTNGTAESAFTLLLLLVVYHALRLPKAPGPAITGMGIALAIALLVRYEALAIAGMATLGVVAYHVAQRRAAAVTRAEVTRVEAMLSALLFPVVFVGILWLFFNWTIQGNPFFFYTSAYSIRGAADVARNAPGHVLEYAVHSVPGTLWYVTQRTLQVSAAFVPAVLLVVGYALRRRDALAALMLMVALAIHAMQAYQAYSGSIAPWLRYWVYLPLLTPILFAYVLAQPASLIRLGRAGRTAVLSVLVPMLLLASSIVTFEAMQSPAVGYDEQIFSLVLAGNRDEAETVRGKIPSKQSAELIAATLNATEGLILVDKQRAPLFIMSLDDPGRLIIDSDRDFEEIVHRPTGTADWVLLPDPAEDSEASLAHDSIYLVHPDLYEGAPWLELEHEFLLDDRNWRLYRVTDPSEPGVRARP